MPGPRRDRAGAGAAAVREPAGARSSSRPTRAAAVEAFELRARRLPSQAGQPRAGRRRRSTASVPQPGEPVPEAASPDRRDEVVAVDAAAAAARGSCRARDDPLPPGARRLRARGHLRRRATSCAVALGELERRWEPYSFHRVHRGFLVNLRRAVEVRPQLNGTALLVLGRRQPSCRSRAARSRSCDGGSAHEPPSFLATSPRPPPTPPSTCGACGASSCGVALLSLVAFGGLIGALPLILLPARRGLHEAHLLGVPLADLARRRAAVPAVLRDRPGSSSAAPTVSTRRSATWSKTNDAADPRDRRPSAGHARRSGIGTYGVRVARTTSRTSSSPRGRSPRGGTRPRSPASTCPRRSFLGVAGPDAEVRRRRAVAAGRLHRAAT